MPYDCLSHPAYYEIRFWQDKRKYRFSSSTFYYNKSVAVSNIDSNVKYTLVKGVKWTVHGKLVALFWPLNTAETSNSLYPKCKHFLFFLISNVFYEQFIVWFTAGGRAYTAHTMPFDHWRKIYRCKNQQCENALWFISSDNNQRQYVPSRINVWTQYYCYYFFFQEHPYRNTLSSTITANALSLLLLKIRFFFFTRAKNLCGSSTFTHAS